MEYPKKLIEVALPLDDLNEACSHEKMPGIGAHPRGLHLWWARRPLAAARAVLFAQLVNDPGGKRGYGAYKGQTKEKAQKERERLFDIIRELVKWENINNEEVLEKARAEIIKSWEVTCKITGDDPSKLPAFHDPFAGGGAIPLEAQRLGLESYASDLNPVAVMINKAMIEIPPIFFNQKPIGSIPNGEDKKALFEKKWQGSEGLAEDVRRYGIWILHEAKKKIGKLYPKVEITTEMIQERADLHGLEGHKLSIIAWIWARTVKSPNPAYRDVDVPLVTTFMLSNKKGREAWIEPVINGKKYEFKVRTGKLKNLALKNGTKAGRGASFNCLLSGSPLDKEYVRAEFQSKKSGKRLLAIVCEGDRKRLYLSPSKEMEEIALGANPQWKPTQKMNQECKDLVSGRGYGIREWHELFTERQLVALSTFSDLVQLIKDDIRSNASEAGLPNDNIPLSEGGEGAEAYADAICIYLNFAISRLADFNNCHTGWRVGNEKIMNMFNRQAIAMTWDFGEANILGDSVGSWIAILNYQVKCIKQLSSSVHGYADQGDAMQQTISQDKIVSTDPPYYDNISYADLSDFFYIWLREPLKKMYPDLFSTISVPKEEELITSVYRHQGKKEAELFFLQGMTTAIGNLAKRAHKAFPVTIYYAFKQTDTTDMGTVSSGWEAFLEAVIKAGFLISGTWPMRSEQSYRMISMGTNSLASSIVLVCRNRPENIESIPRKRFIRELKEILPEALADMIGGKEFASPIAPVDLAQAAIGPGMAVFSKYSEVLEADGTPMSVHNALILINETIDEYFTEAEGEMDSDTRFCVDWFQQYGFKEGIFGEADVLSRAKGTSVDGVQDAGVLIAKGGKVRLLKVSEYPEDWDPKTDKRTPIWEACHHMCRSLQISETKAGALLAKMPEKAEAIRQLAYRLYTLCERKGWAEDAGLYNGLITSWHAILEESHKVGHVRQQKTLFDE